MEFSGQYLTYAQYKALGGTLAETPFNLLEYEARKQIDKYTFGRLINLTSQEQEVKLCVYELINYSSNISPAINTNNSNVKSENTDGYSISYIDLASKDGIEANNNRIKDIIYTYLANSKLEDGTPYLYRGADVN